MVHFQNGCPRVRETGSSRRSELPGKNEYNTTFITFLSLFKNAFFPEKIFLNTCLAESLKKRERQEEKQTELPKKKKISPLFSHSSLENTRMTLLHMLNPGLLAPAQRY